MKKMETNPVIVERVFDAPVEKVWEALTDNEKMKAWYFDIAAFRPEVGFEFQFYGGSDQKKYLHLCKVTVAIPGKKLAYTWKYEGYPGESEVSFELFAEGQKTRLKLTHRGLESFPDDNADFARGSFNAGWEQIIGSSLKKYLEKS